MHVRADGLETLAGVVVETNAAIGLVPVGIGSGDLARPQTDGKGASSERCGLEHGPFGRAKIVDVEPGRSDSGGDRATRPRVRALGSDEFEEVAMVQHAPAFRRVVAEDREGIWHAAHIGECEAQAQGRVVGAADPAAGPRAGRERKHLLDNVVEHVAAQER